MVSLSPRRERILRVLDADGRVSVADLAQRCDVSEVTIRKDLQELEELSFLKRVHGGAVVAHRSKYNLAFVDRIGKLAANKSRIGLAAVDLIADGDSIILDAGSSTLALARLLPGRRRGLTVITNSMPIITELGSVGEFDVVSLGGAVRGHSLAMIGPLTVAALARLHADRAFIGATGVAVPQGVSTPNLIESETKAAMIHAATHRTVLADHTKIGLVSLAPFAAWSEIDVLITDLPLPEGFERDVGAHGVVALVAHDDGAPPTSSALGAARGRPAGGRADEGEQP